MSLLPYLTETQNASKKYSLVFRGINYGEEAQDGEFSETQNISTDKFPCLTQRAERIKEGQYESPSAIHAKGELLIIDGTDVLYGGEKVGEVDIPGKKQIATVGEYIVIFPDKKYYKVPSSDEAMGKFGSMEETYTESGLEFSESEITTTGPDFNFENGDAVEITDCSNNANNKSAIIRAASPKKLTFDDNTFTRGTESGQVTITREVPDLDFICESNYRLWGTQGNTIYASKYSSPFNFKVFDGLSSDSYYIQVGSEGEFTGCIPYSSHICFFKENTLHKLYGTKPSNFQLNTVNVYGVQSGSEKSMHIVNEQLLYKGTHGVYAYTGGIPELISGNFGNNRYSDAVASCDGEKYYISMKQGGKWHLFAYDVLRNIWIHEDNTEAVGMAFYNGNVHFIDSNGGLYCIDKVASKSNIEWSATLCTIHETMNERKGYSKFHLRMDLASDAYLAVDIKTDNEPLWQEIYKTHNEKAKTISIPITPTRCDSIDIRLRGKGECTVKAFIREFMTGSDI